MPYRMHEKQLGKVLSLPTKERYLHFLNKVADWEQLWILCDEKENIFTRKAEENFEYLPVWPHPNYAKETAKNIEINLFPSEVPLNEFIEKWLPGLKKDNLKVGVFPNKEGTVWVIGPDDLLESLIAECEQYE